MSVMHGIDKKIKRRDENKQKKGVFRKREET